MVDIWNVFNKLEFIGTLEYDEDTQQFAFSYAGKTQKAFEAYQILGADLSPASFKARLFDRVCPPNRRNIKELLKKAHMKKYDAWEIIKYVHLNSLGDLIWMSKEKDPEGFYKYHTMGYIMKHGDAAFEQS